MEALQTVFDTIMEVINIIKAFFEELFGAIENDDAAADDTTDAPAA